MSWSLSQISQSGANPLLEWGQLECKKGVSSQHTTFTSSQNAACSNEFFLLRVDYALERSTFN